MFLKNKYTTWYYNIINNARYRELTGYMEKHHILPKSLGGDDSANNIVNLTAKEHFICHLLLVHMVDGGDMKYKMTCAALMMANLKGPGQKRYRITSRTYSLLKKERVVSDNTKKLMSESQLIRFSHNHGTFLGRKHSDSTRKKMSISASKPKSDAWKLSASKNRKGRVAPNKGIPHSEDTKKKISDSLKGEKNPFYGKTHTLEQRQRKSKEKLSAEKKVCPHCGKTIDKMNYGRWHGDKCKSKR